MGHAKSIDILDLLRSDYARLEPRIINDAAREIERLRRENDTLRIIAAGANAGVPEGFRLVRNEPGDMVQIDRLIGWLTTIRERFGNSCVYARDVCWGAVALNRQDDDKQASAAGVNAGLVAAEPAPAT